MQLIEVTDKKTGKDFIKANVQLIAIDPNYIRPLNKDVNDVFDPEKNKAFRFGECKRWILKNDEGKFIGRIAAFINKKYKNKGDDVPLAELVFLIALITRKPPTCFLMLPNIGFYRKECRRWTDR